VKTDSLRINQLSEQTFGWYLDYLTVLDAKDVESYVQLLSHDVELVIGNADPVVGREAVRAMLANYWQSFAEIEHDLRNVLGDDTNFVLEADNHYVTLDGRRVTVRAVAFTDRGPDGLVRSVRLHGDTTELFNAQT
jgi:SnoaL-like domain